MPVVQISKIQMRRGPTLDLPGAPTTPGDSTTLTLGLDIGEFGFATDTGQLFIGADPAFATVNRVQFPYRNVEVLTEYSSLIRNLLPHTTVLTTVAINTPISTGIILSTSLDGLHPGNGATIDYSFIEITNTTPAAQHGRLLIVTDGTQAGTTISDSNVSAAASPGAIFSAVVASANFVINVSTTLTGSFTFSYRIH